MSHSCCLLLRVKDLPSKGREGGREVGRGWKFRERVKAGGERGVTRLLSLNSFIFFLAFESFSVAFSGL